MGALIERLTKLLAVKSIVTVILTVVFAYMAVTGVVTAEQFLTVFTVVIAFYFGTQAERRAQTTETMTGTLVLPEAVSESDTQQGGETNGQSTDAA